MNIEYIEQEPVQDKFCCESFSPTPDNQHDRSLGTQTKVYFSKNDMECQPKRISSSKADNELKQMVSEDEFLS